MVFHLYWLTQIMWQTCFDVCLTWIILLPRSSLEGKDWQVKSRTLTSGIDETMHFSASIKMCPLTLPPLFPNPLRTLVYMLALHLEVQWACRKESCIHSLYIRDNVSYLGAWCGGCPHFCSRDQMWAKPASWKRWDYWIILCQSIVWGLGKQAVSLHFVETGHWKKQGLLGNLGDA